MTEHAELKDVIHKTGMTRKDQILLCLASTSLTPKSIAEIRSIATGIGLRRAKTWNVSGILMGMAGDAVRVNGGWELTTTGRARARALIGTPAPVAASTLRSVLPKLPDAEIRKFVSEAIDCYEAKMYRAAVVLAWVGAVALLYDHIVTTKLAAFNAEAKRRDAKWRNAANADDLARMKEHDFLQVAEAVSVIGKSVKGELEACLKLRNGCGHPNSPTIAEHRVASHIEVLALNVFSKFT